MANAFPGETFGGCTGLETGELEGGGIVGEGGDPFGSEEGVVGLTLEAADFEALSVEGDDGFGFDAAQDGFAGDEVVEGDGGGVGLDAEGAADEAIGQLDLAAIGAGLDPGALGLGIDEPIDRCRRVERMDPNRQEEQRQSPQPMRKHLFHFGPEVIRGRSSGRGKFQAGSTFSKSAIARSKAGSCCQDPISASRSV
jgi:hypothetical protein